MERIVVSNINTIAAHVMLKNLVPFVAAIPIPPPPPPPLPPMLINYVYPFLNNYC